MIGQTISHYQITAKLGEGGMGVVYKAEDAKLDRTVALKFIAANLIKDSEARKRFEREAKAAAGVSHANVCHVYEIADADGYTFLAMEFVEGESLDKRIERGPLSLKDALDIARQTAEGLAAAHAKGLVHRDVKPANLLVTPGGQAKILDFGLALLSEGSKLTQLDTKVGTVAYMSPEQAQGMKVDHRTDVWALGCVLYEMVSGRRPFLGHYDQALVYSIVNEPPEPLTGLRTGVPMELEFIVGKCLEKDAGSRYQQVSDIAVDLRNLQDKLKSGRSTILRSVGAPGAPAVPAGASLGVPPRFNAPGTTLSPVEALPPGAVMVQQNRLRMLQVLAVLAVAATLGLLALAFVHFTGSSREPAEKPVRRFSFAPEGLASGSISPDGKYILYAAQSDGANRLWLRSLASESAREVPGTAGVIVRDGFGGFWSPDSLSIGFAADSPDLQLRRISIDGGDPITLCPLPEKSRVPFLGGTWSPDGQRIVFSSGWRLYEVAARGGQSRLMSDMGDGPRPGYGYPQFLPPGGGPPALAYVALSSPADQWLAVLNLQTGDRREICAGSQAVYSPGGYLIHGPTSITEQALWALPFSLATLQPTGENFPLSATGSSPTVSEDGTLAYLDVAASDARQTLARRDRTGNILETLGQPQPGMALPALSPDGQRIAVISSESGDQEIWVHDLIRSTKTRVTFGAESLGTITWSPSGSEIAYGSSIGISRKAADGTGEAVVLAESANRLAAPDWSRDGRYMVYQEYTRDAGTDIHYLRFENGGEDPQSATFLATAADERLAKLSPDSRFLAYVSNESGRNEIYLRSFPDGAGKWQASVNGGTQPRWRLDGRELYYVEPEDRLMVVAVSTGPDLTLGQPRILFDSEDLGRIGTTPHYDAFGDGQSFVTITAVEERGSKREPPRIRVVENWYEEFRNRETN